MKIYDCKICGKVVEETTDIDIPTFCCGMEMTLHEANTVDAAIEKHVPVYTVDDNKEEITVNVGEVNHPMDYDHYITWIALETNNQTIRVNLEPEELPTAKFPYIKGSIIYAYCDKHGLWKKEVE